MKQKPKLSPRYLVACSLSVYVLVSGFNLSEFKGVIKIQLGFDEAKILIDGRSSVLPKTEAQD